MSALNMTEKQAAWAFLSPTIIVLAALTVYPLVWSCVIAVQNINLFNPSVSSWVGLDNFSYLLFHEETFWKSMKLTMIWCLVTVPVEFLVGFLLALMLNTDARGVGIWRTMIIIPVFISPVAMGLTWRFMFEPVSGIINFLLGSVGIGRIAWHTSSSTALVTVMIADIWQWTPFVTLILLAGIQAIPVEIAEASRLDGLRAFQYTLRMVIPLLWPVAAVALLLRVVDSIRIFDLVYVITRGGPGSATLVASVNAYTIFQAGRIGIMAAYGFFIVILINIVVFAFLRVLRRNEKRDRLSGGAV
jgi:multiple sugar transport system permease protein